MTMVEGDEMVLTVRVPADLMHNARVVAAQRDETLSQVVRRALRAYAGLGPPQLDLEDAIRGQRQSAKSRPKPSAKAMRRR
jgi:hypothetical protein